MNSPSTPVPPTSVADSSATPGASTSRNSLSSTLQTIDMSQGSSSSESGTEGQGQSAIAINEENDSSLHQGHHLVSRNLRRHQLQIARMINCVVCLQPSSIPIYECDLNAHLTCSLCFTNNPAPIKSCRLCQSILTRRSIFAERISRENNLHVQPQQQQPQNSQVVPVVVVKCAFKLSGCKADTAVPGHSGKTCEYRNITCLCKLNPDNKLTKICKSNIGKIAMKDYAQHWTQTASLLTKNSITSIAPNKFGFHFKMEPSFFASRAENYTDTDPWNGHSEYYFRLVEFDNHAFILRSVIHEHMWHCWLLILGGHGEADQYTYQAALVKGRTTDTTSIDVDEVDIVNVDVDGCDVIRDNCPVLPYHRFLDYEKLCGDYASATTARISRYHRRKSIIPHDYEKFAFNVVITLNKRTDMDNNEVRDAEVRAPCRSAPSEVEEIGSGSDAVLIKRFKTE